MMRRVEMRKFALVCIAVALLAGCTRMPSGQRACLITAQLSLTATVADANSAKDFPWRQVDPNETPTDTIARLRLGQMLLVRVMSQANENLIEVVRWSEGSAEGLPAKKE
jgi:hypothetical protein